MPKVYFRTSLEKEVWNWWESLNSGDFEMNWAEYCPKEVRVGVEGKSAAEAKIYLRSYLKKRYRSDEGVKMFKGPCKAFWKSIEGRFFERLENVTKRPSCNKALSAIILLPQEALMTG